MNNSNLVSGTLKLLIVAAGLFLIALGIKIIVEWSPVYQPMSATNNPHTDSSVIKKVTSDTANKKITSTSEITVYRTAKPEGCSTCITTLNDNMLKKGYDFVLLGILLILAVLILPFISSVSILSVFTANFRAKVEAGKAIINEAANAANAHVTASKPATEAVPVTSLQSDGLKNLSDELPEPTTIQKYADDYQKGRWGGQQEKNSRKITASVTPLETNSQLFKVIIKVLSTDVQKPLTDKVVFHLHPSFPNKDPEIYVVQGEAKLELIAWGAFTVGAVTDGGSTKLELDLAEIPEAPILFKSR